MKNSTSLLICWLRRQSYLLSHVSLRVIAIAVALELGVLNPLGCILHCLIQQWMAEQTTSTFFFCDLHHDGTITEGASPLATIHPRAVYEALPSLAVAVIVIVPLLMLLNIPRQLLLQPCLPPPPTPPPRRASLSRSLV